jgi:hypothetical protein
MVAGKDDQILRIIRYGDNDGRILDKLPRKNSWEK